MCCHTDMPCRRHRTRHPTPSQYTDTGPTCHCAIHCCNTQLPILMSWVRPSPDRKILPWLSTQTSERSTLWYWYGGSQSEARYDLTLMLCIPVLNIITGFAFTYSYISVQDLLDRRVWVYRTGWVVFALSGAPGATSHLNIYICLVYNMVSHRS